MKSSKSQTHSKVHRIPTLRFEATQQLTSYAGLVVFQALFQVLRLKDRLRACFSHLRVQSIFGHHNIFLLLVVHLLLGFRRLRGLDYYRHDPLVARVLGLRRVPDVATVSRALGGADARSVEQIRALSRKLVSDRLVLEQFPRLTLDFDGSVQSTTGHAEGTAVGFNKVKKGARSYWPLYCTLAQTGQFWDLLHRAGNVHDSNGAEDFMRACIAGVREVLPFVVLESRMDSAFFSESILEQFAAENCEFTASVPFERFPELKARIAGRAEWHRIDKKWSFFEDERKPKKWAKESKFRFIFYRQHHPKQRKGPLQLDLFVPVEFEYDYKVVVTTKKCSAASVLWFHNGRGGQEKIFGEGKQHVALDLIATRRLIGNQLFTLAGMMAHNLTRELQMQVLAPIRGTEPKRATFWDFLQLGTLRQRLLHQAGRLTWPQGELTLTMNDTPAVRTEMLQYVEALARAA